MKPLKHSKYKNTGILFELLIVQYTSDVLKGVESPQAMRIMKEHFSKKSELIKELRLYKYLQEKKATSEYAADKLIEAVLKARTNIKEGKLAKEKYQLVKDIRESYSEDLFLTRVKGYAELASTYKIFEHKEESNPIDYQRNKQTLIESVLKDPVEYSEGKKKLLEGDVKFKQVAYEILITKLNKKYEGLLPQQKTILKEYIESVSNSPKLKQFIEKEAKQLKEDLLKESASITDPIVKIKVEKVGELLEDVQRCTVVEDKHISGLLKYHELINELKELK